MPQERLAPSTAQVQTAQKLLGEVPPLAYDWTSKPGRAFLDYVDTLASHGVPVAWLAEQLHLDTARLYATLARYRNQTAYRGVVNGN